MTNSAVTRDLSTYIKIVPWFDKSFVRRRAWPVDDWCELELCVVHGERSCPSWPVWIFNFEDILPRGELWGHPWEKNVTIGSVISVVRAPISNVRNFHELAIVVILAVLV